MDYLRSFYAWISGKAEREAMLRVIQGNNSFAFSVYQAIKKEKRFGNDIVFSPAALQIVLGMLWIGCSKEGRQQIEETLQLPPDRDTIIDGFKTLRSHLQSMKSAKMKIATRIFTPGHVRLKKDFYISCGQYFEVSLKPTDFHRDGGRLRDEANCWVWKSTMYRVEQIIRRQRMDDCAQVLIVNGVNFENELEVPFLSSDSTMGIFNVTDKETRIVKFLNQTGVYRYSECEELQSHILELRCKNPALSMILLLPYTVDGIIDLETKLPGVEVKKLFLMMSPQRMKTRIPKFQLLEGYDISNHLYDTGINVVTDTQSNALKEVADVYPPLSLSHLMHKTYFEFIEEEDTPITTDDEAVSNTTSCSNKMFRADHPFIFMVVDKETGLIIVLGRVTFMDHFDISMLMNDTGTKVFLPNMSRGVWGKPRSKMSAEEEEMPLETDELPLDTDEESLLKNDSTSKTSQPTDVPSFTSNINLQVDQVSSKKDVESNRSTLEINEQPSISDEASSQVNEIQLTMNEIQLNADQVSSRENEVSSKTVEISMHSSQEINESTDFVISSDI